MEKRELVEYSSVKATLNVINNSKETVGKIELKGKFAILSNGKSIFVGFLGKDVNPYLYNVYFTKEKSTISYGGQNFSNNINLNIKDLQRTRIRKEVSEALEGVAKNVNKNYFEKIKLEKMQENIDKRNEKITNSLKETKETPSSNEFDLLSELDNISKKVNDILQKGSSINTFHISNLTNTEFTYNFKIPVYLYNVDFAESRFKMHKERDGELFFTTNVRSKQSLTQETLKLIEYNHDMRNSGLLQVVENLTMFKPVIELENGQRNMGALELKITIGKSFTEQDKKRLLENVKTISNIRLFE